MRRIVVLLSLFQWIAVISYGQSKTVEVWIRVFIPDPEHAGDGTGYIKPNQSNGGGSLVILPDWGVNKLDYCFATDHRGFSNSKGTSRLETRFAVSLSVNGEASISSMPYTQTSETSELDCKTGAVLAKKLGSIDRDTQGKPSIADGVVQVIGQVTGTNVLNPFGRGGPAIDYSYDLKWQPSKSTLSVDVSYGMFPAFEMYARQPSGPWVAVLQRTPSGSPWRLMADGIGINTKRETVSVIVPGMAGKWQANTLDQRFTLNIKDKQVQWSERSANGNTLTREAIMIEQPDGSFRIERPNDAEVLAFLGFQPSLRAEIMARGPLPSFITLSWDDANIKADWNGLFVTKNSDASLKEMVQPGIRPAKAYSLIRVP